MTTQGQQEIQFFVDRLVRTAASTSDKEVLAAVFGPSTAHQLNLIMCSGIWTGNEYD
ncbi:MAG: hypothetical protein NVS4B7_14660 [Ktedonobacteraceae bacterium]